MLFALTLLAASLDSRPPAEDIARFPSRETIEALMSFNWEYRRQMEYRANAEPWRFFQYRKIIDYCEGVADLYGVLKAAQEPEYEYDDAGVPRELDQRNHCRDQLAELRSRLGSAAYYAGQMPEPVPMLAFEPIR